MNQRNLEIIMAFTFILIGLFFLVDQITLFLGWKVGNIVHALVILAGLLCIITGVALFADKEE
ncbi:MAG: hypothetical protein NT120_02115 [Candidatus Aenigmarchaeota archaeon]|nr:hypothetical protein [Candidatus Aenigmarchaeota archaeon]